MIIQNDVYKILVQVILEKGHCNVLLAQMMRDKNLTLSEKEAIEKIVLGILKNQIYLDYILNQIWNVLKSVITIPFHITILLWIVLYEIYFLEITNKEIFIENTLKKVSTIDNKLTFIISKVLDLCFTEFRSEFNLQKESKQNIKLIKYSYPSWLYSLIKSQFSINIANQLIKDNLRMPLISFRVNTLKTTVNKVLNNENYKSFNFCLSEIVSDGIISSKSIFNTKLYENGEIIKQDQASMLVSHILDPQPYDEVLDMCAGIASKTAHMAALMSNHGKIVACDINEERLKIGATYLKKLGVTNTELKYGDSTILDFNNKFDKILIDAPSTAWGLIKRKPEVKLINWSKEEINQLITVQAKLLNKAYQLLKPEAIVVYVTCTFNIKENQNQIENFVKNHPDMTIIAEKQFFGFNNNTDGFYICKLKKGI
ncbi:methyltransferase domain-containing protein [Spiroplasma endosymbiont of Danaus chrysippus]|uniref:methyltransferase domain-containing protein n=1 Tax=Spiroplasma endosymbiont of Danaus chrysippus TaxID=2691041 RepID=UPI00157B4601|nr:methyltransferase domain-containing protein [Spiroplasma endosymbiont of Danaus chrysippus]